MTATPDTPQVDDGPADSQESIGPAWLDAFRSAEQPSWLEASALAAVLTTFWLLGGGWGAIAWVVVASSWLVFPPVVAVALGQYALIALTPIDSGFATVLPGSMALLALLVGNILTERQALSDGLLLLGSTVIIGGGVLGLVWTSGLLAGVIGVVGILATVSYLLHRLLLFKLGHLTETSP